MYTSTVIHNDKPESVSKFSNMNVVNIEIALADNYNTFL